MNWSKLKTVISIKYWKELGLIAAAWKWAQGCDSENKTRVGRRKEKLTLLGYTIGKPVVFIVAHMVKNQNCSEANQLVIYKI